MGRVRARKRTAPPTDRSLLPVPHPNARATAHSHCKTAIWVLFCTTTPPGHLFLCLEITGTPHNTPRVAIVRRRNDLNAKSASFKTKKHSKIPDPPTASIPASPSRELLSPTFPPLSPLLFSFFPYPLFLLLLISFFLFSLYLSLLFPLLPFSFFSLLGRSVPNSGQKQRGAAVRDEERASKRGAAPQMPPMRPPRRTTAADPKCVVGGVSIKRARVD